MRVYRVSFYSNEEGMEGYGYYSSLSRAKKESADWIRGAKAAETIRDSKIYRHEIPLTKKGLLSALNSLASHADNG